MLNFIFLLVFGKLQAVGTCKHCPVWLWAVGSASLYALTAIGLGVAIGKAYHLNPTLNPLAALAAFSTLSVWLALYFKLLRTTSGNPLLHRCIYWGMAAASALWMGDVLTHIATALPHIAAP